MVALASLTLNESYVEPSPYAWLRSRVPVPTSYAPACAPLYAFREVLKNRISRARGITGSCTKVVERKHLFCIEIWQVELESCVWRVSFHKYAYVHGDPVQGIDPTGKSAIFSLLQLLSTITFAPLMGSLVGDDEDSQPWFRRYKSGVGGVDITRHLTVLRNKLESEWNSRTPDEQKKLFASLSDMTPNHWYFEPEDFNAMHGWDIKQLAWDKSSFKGTTNASRVIDQTVTVNNKVYFAEEVNYYLIGLVYGLANKSRLTNSLGLRSSFDDIEFTIRGYRSIYINEYFSGSVGGRVAWARRGYLEILEAYGSRNHSDTPQNWALPNATPNTEVHSSRLNAHIGETYSRDPKLRINLWVGDSNAIVLP
jgi:hypothetical protein